MHALRPLRGQAASARNVLRLLDGSAIIESHRWCDKVQDAYSLRCAPQVHGASRDLLDYVEYTVTTELNAATDNPLVLVEDDMLVSAGNFHGQPLAFALDALAMAVAEFASISERRVERLVNPNLSGGLPAFLTTDGGLNSGFMIPQYVAASLVSENKSLCHPASVDSIPTSAGQEDHVSMGNAAGLKAWQVLANAELALAIELLAATQAVEFLAPLEPGRRDARGARRGARAVAAASRRPLAERRHRGRRGSRARRLAARRRRGCDRSARVSDGKRRLRWQLPETPPPKHPVRDTLLVYAGLAVVVVLVAWVDRRLGRQGDRRRAVVLRRGIGSGASGALARRSCRRQPRDAAGTGVASSDGRTGSLDALVESLCGDLSSIRAPRGSTLNARSWATEAPLRMLLNNLDAGGRRAPRGARRLRRHRAGCALARGAARDRARAARCWRTTRRCSSSPASPSPCSGRRASRRAC